MSREAERVRNGGSDAGIREGRREGLGNAGE